MIEVLIAIVFLVLAAWLGSKLKTRYTMIGVGFPELLAVGDHVRINGLVRRVAQVDTTSITLEAE